jgi:superfamily II DNA or RNA helicase
MRHIGSVVQIANSAAEHASLVTSRKSLQVANPKFVQAVRFGNPYAPKPPKHVFFFEDNGADSTYPRGWYLQNRVAKVPLHVINTSQVTVKFPRPALAAHQHQQEAVTKVLEYVAKNDLDGIPTDCIVKMPPSSGKTILGMLLMSDINQKTLVVVPTKEVEAAWRSDFQKVFPKVPIGSIRGKQIDTDKPITIASINTLMNLNPLLWGDAFGLAIYDEVHRIPGEKFSECVKNCAAHIRIGLTATNYRKDGMFALVEAHLGKTVFSLDGYVNSVPLEYNAIKTGIGYTGELDEPTFNDLITNLVENERRNSLIDSLVKHVATNFQGDILVVGHRVDHLRSLAERCKFPCGLIVGDMNAADRKRTYQDVLDGVCKVTFATTKIMSEGASNPRWCHVINTTPFSDRKTMVQLCGRPIRIQQGKTHGTFWDLIDTNPMTVHMGRARWKYIQAEMKTSLRKTSTLQALIRPNNTYTFRDY